MKTLLAAAVLFFLSGCSCGQPVVPPVEAVWAKTTTPFDPTCAKCTQIGDGDFSHIGEGTRVFIDAKTDDPPAQWGRCTMGLMKCLDGDGEIPACVEGAPCPAACKAEFKKLQAGSADFEAQADAVEKTFYADGSKCAPPQTPEVTP